MAIATYDQLVAALPTSQVGVLSKASIATQNVGALTSLWLAAGFPAAGAIPGAAATCNSALVGGWPFTNPTNPVLSYLASFSVSGTTSHQLLLYDRLVHMGGLNATLLTAQTVGCTIPGGRGAAVNGGDVDWFIEVYTAIGTTATTLTVTYTDQTDTSRVSPAIAFGGASPANQPSRLYRIIPNAGQTIKTVTSLTVLASTLVAGSFGVTGARRILSTDMGQPNIGRSLDFAGTKLARIYDNACLWFVLNCSNATTGAVLGGWDLIQG